MMFVTIATVWETGCSCDYDTFRIDQQWLWGDAVT